MKKIYFISDSLQPIDNTKQKEFIRKYQFRGIQDGKEIYHLSVPLKVNHSGATHTIQDFAYDPQTQTIAGVMVNNDQSVNIPPEYAFVFNAYGGMNSFFKQHNYTPINQQIKRNKGPLEIDNSDYQNPKPKLDFYHKLKTKISSMIQLTVLPTEILDFFLEHGFVVHTLGVIPISILGKFSDNYGVKEDQYNGTFLINNVGRIMQTDEPRGNKEELLTIAQYTLYREGNKLSNK